MDGLDADLTAGSAEVLERARGWLRAVEVDANTLEHRGDPAEGLLSVVALELAGVTTGHPWVGPGVNAWEFISGRSDNPMVDLGWKSVVVLELTALPSIGLPDQTIGFWGVVSGPCRVPGGAEPARFGGQRPWLKPS